MACGDEIYFMKQIKKRRFKNDSTQKKKRQESDERFTLNTLYTQTQSSKEVESTLAKIQRNNIVIYLLAHLLDCVLRTYIPSIIWRTTALRQSCFRFFQLEVWVLFIVDCWNSQQHFEMDATLDFQSRFVSNYLG